MKSEKAWPMNEKAVYFGRKLENPESIKEFVQRYFGTTPDGAHGNFAPCLDSSPYSAWCS
jgi:hypothetical protein